jgi:hypothetical protein
MMMRIYLIDGRDGMRVVVDAGRREAEWGLGERPRSFGELWWCHLPRPGLDILAPASCIFVSLLSIS